MRAINHTVTGALVGATVVNPLVALPLALLSHIILDAIPHSGSKSGSHLSTWFKLELAIDAALSASFLLAIYLLQIDNWLLILGCGVLGAAPDLWWMPYWIFELRGKPMKFDKIGLFLSKIQWYEKPFGYVIEAIWLALTLYLFLAVTV